MVNGQEIQRTNNVPYIQENLGLASLVNFYHKSYFHINLTSINKNIQNYITNVYFISLKAHNNTLYNLLENSMISLQEKYKLLTHQRNKRSLFDGLGTAIRYITGNLDQDDLKEIMSNMQILRNNENKITLQNTKTLSLLSFMQNKFENNTNFINQEFLQIIKNLNKINEATKLQELIIKEIFNIKSLESYIDKLLNIITFSITEELNLLLISSSDIIKVEQILNTIFPLNELISFSKLYYFEFMSLCKLNTIISDHEIIFVLKIPIVYNITYNYQKLYPVLFDNSSLLIIPRSYVLEDKEIYFLEKPCLELSTKEVLCYKVYNNECNLKTLSNCLIVQNTNYSRIEVMNNNHLLVNTNQKVPLFEHCNKTQIIVNHPVVISKYCEISTLQNTYIFKNTINSSIKLPNVEKYDFILQKINFVPADSYHSIKDKIKNLQHDVVLNNLKWEHRSISISIYVILLILCSIYLVYKYRSKLKFKNCKKSTKMVDVEDDQVLKPLKAVQVIPSLSQGIQA